jgi:hypothetical protein
MLIVLWLVVLLAATSVAVAGAPIMTASVHTLTDSVAVPTLSTDPYPGRSISARNRRPS